jgi:outer membrane protein TolC
MGKRVSGWCALLVLLVAGSAGAEGIRAEDVMRREEPKVETSDETRELVTREEAVALALQANRLVKNPERLKFIAETVTKAYAGVVDAYGVLARREEHLKASREVERVVIEQTEQAKASPADLRTAQAGVTRATEEVLTARQAANAQTRQLNHLMGREPQARLRVRPEPDLVPATALSAGALSRQ